MNFFVLIFCSFYFDYCSIFKNSSCLCLCFSKLASIISLLFFSYCFFPSSIAFFSISSAYIRLFSNFSTISLCFLSLSALSFFNRTTSWACSSLVSTILLSFTFSRGCFRLLMVVCLWRYYSCCYMYYFFVFNSIALNYYSRIWLWSMRSDTFYLYLETAKAPIIRSTSKPFTTLSVKCLDVRQLISSLNDGRL